MDTKHISLLCILFTIFALTLSSCGLAASSLNNAGDNTPPDTAEETPVESPAVSEADSSEDKPLQEDMDDKIKVYSPEPNQVITSPLIIEGEARGFWFFEADFPIKLLDDSGEIIAGHYATALGDWMTEDFVPFESELEFEKPQSKTGYLVLERDNPSGLDEHDEELIIPIHFK
ncbi:MAG: Gmad2 immunoglobulin-like domain-containing protein [Actinomycetota bacterium]